MEIERKFMVKELPAGSRAGSSSRIRQGYFPLRSRDVEIRLREKGPRHFITIKSGRGGARLEEEIPISRKRFEALWPLVRRASITKRRRKIGYAGRTRELDTYAGRHRGLKIAEVEFLSRRHAASFRPPPWLGREVTENPRYSNRALARRRRI